MEPLDKLGAQVESAARALAADDPDQWTTRLISFLQTFELEANRRADHALHPLPERRKIALALERTCYRLIGRVIFGSW